MSYDPEKHQRRSIRLRGYDYTQAGAYFVTLCIRDGECILGNIVDGLVLLNDYGHIVDECWQWLCRQYPYVKLDEWVVMPDHLHGIIVILDDDTSRRGGSRTAPTTWKRKPLGRLIGAFKTVSTKQINIMRKIPGAQVWQRNYFERIVRNETELNRIRQYIIENPSNWESDEESMDRC